MAGHVISRKTYLVVFAALMVLLAATVVVGRINLGGYGLPAALAIASAKALLIAVYFMHLRFSSPLSRLIAAGGLLWLLILLSFTLADYGHR